MKKSLTKFTKILVLIAMIISDLMTPIKVLANEISDSDPVKGDVGINNKVSNNGNSATVSVGSIETEGGVKVTKTVSKTDTEGRYEIEFKIEGKDVKTSTEVSKPVYAVIVFDRSGSMESNRCMQYNNHRECIERNPANKWESAVQGAKDFATTLLTKIPTANIALVAFSGSSDYENYWGNEYLKDGAKKNDDATVLRDFSNTNLNNVDFGSANGGTNLHAGLYEANKLLSDSSIPSDAYKYVVVISDGEPTFYYNSEGYTQGTGNSTNEGTYNATINMTTTVKTKAEVFSIGYMLPSGTVYGDKTAADILTEVATSDSTDSEVKHYVDANPEKVANAFNNIAEEIGTANAGTKAILTDNLGGQFTLTTDSTTRSYVSKEISTITEEGTTLSFYVDIDKDSETGWHNTNAGFKLEYTDAEGEKQTLECGENPQVYWVQNTYDYVVNYYKDSFNNLIKSETRQAPNGTVINESNVERDKYLPDGYEFNTINPSSITITNDGTVEEINILYTIKKFNYVVNYYYDNTLDNTITKTDIPYGTEVNATTYYLKDTDIREGYILDTVKSDSSVYTITDNNVIIDIYYKKNSYEYSVNYFFNSEKGFTTNSEAIYGDKITAQSKWLSNERLLEENKTDYFLDPNKSSENNSEIIIGTDKDKNVLDIYYINTNFDNTTETISKVTNTTKVTSSNNIVSYKVNYNTTINNVREGDIVKVTIIDTLPGSIIDSNLNGGVYNSENNTITWTKSYNITEYKSVYTVSEEISYTVKYEDYLSNNGSTLINAASGFTTVSHEGLDDKTTNGTEDSATVPVEIKGTVTVYFKDENGNDISSKESLEEKLAGTSYTTTPKTVVGYTLNEEKLPENKNGNYTEGNIDVIYYYTKNDGDITENEVTKIGPDTVNSINDTFNYTLTYKGKVENYVGKATLTITDTIPFEGTIVTDNNACTFKNNTITCTKEYTVNGSLEINESFDISVKYTNINTDKVVNKVNSTLALENNSAKDEDEIETEVYKGTVVATYKDTEGNKLTEDVTTTGLAGTEYTTEEKEFFGYTLKEVPSNKEGTYRANETIYVDYVYTKNVGDVTENNVNKVQNNIITNINSEYHYVLSYSGKVENYVGDVTLELTDILPYNAKIISKDNKCIVDGRTIVCTDVYTIDKEHQIVNATFNIVLKYKTVGAEVKNIVNSKLIYGNKVAEDTAEVIDTIPSGKVTASYITDTEVKLHDDVTTTDLVGKEYTTEEKEFFGYTLKEVKGNETGTYTKEDIKVVYIYTKNAGDIENPETEKTGPNAINSVDDKFDYVINSKASIKYYVGDATLTVKDVLPYTINEENSDIDSRCVYDGNKTITCVVEYENIDEEDYTDGVFEVNETFNLSLTFIDVNTEKVVNKAESTIDLDGNKKTTEDEIETEVYKGTVKATYTVDSVDGDKLCEDVTTTGLAGTDYTTENKSFYGYTLKEVTGSNREGVYQANTTLVVSYIYTKNVGDVTENEVSKIQTNIITDIDSEYHYVLSYSGKVEDYAGEVTLELTDTLPYNAIIISKDAKCSVNGRTITCSDVYTVDKEHQIINAKFDIVLKYTTVGSEVKNVVNSKLIYGNNHVTDSAEVTDEVPSGTVNVYYEDNDGNEIADMDSLGERLVGTYYTTTAKDVFGYTLDGDKLPDNESGKYINGNIEVIYYYTKNAGEIDEPSTKKTGPETIESVNGVFEYDITASGKVKDYVGDVTLTVKDILPYAIDTEKSVLDDRCVYEASANTITCTVEYNNINKEDYTDGIFEVNETFNLSLVFVDVDSEEVINKAESTIDLDGNKKTTDDETETEVYKGTVVATYKDTLGNTLCDDETTTGLVGTDYTTEEKEFFGYSLVEVKGNKEGIYSKDTIYVDYVYTKTTGTGDIEELPPQTGVEVNNFNNYLLILMMLMIIVKGYRSLKETL